MKKPKYPIYIVSKGRADLSYTAKAFKKDDIDFTLVVEPQEYENYKEHLPWADIQELPFKNLGKGSYPARNWCWEDALDKGYKRHWIFDDNIRGFYRLHKGNRFGINGNIALYYVEQFTDRYSNIYVSGLNYHYLINSYQQKPFKVNAHVYSAMLIKNDISYRWRLKYNEDVDLCLQVITDGYCTVLFDAFLIDKISTAAKLKGGNQTELYQGNNPRLKLKKAQTLKRKWPDHVEIVERYGRPHHYVNWNKFTHGLKRREDIDFDNLSNEKVSLNLKKVNDKQSEDLGRYLKTDKKQSL